MNFQGEEIMGSFAVPVTGPSTRSAGSQHCRILNGWMGRRCHHLFLSLEPKARGFSEIKTKQTPLRRTTAVSLHCCGRHICCFPGWEQSQEKLVCHTQLKIPWLCSLLGISQHTLHHPSTPQPDPAC